ncbi:SDR family oxidoreductase [Sphingopyxis sp. YF1]|uniref:SDR family NAD(P)-dependent oxidoreductase n=1 Tax=Sphingopyxis sp. YF1 TaxID=2482763 RepID=UPI001F601991|nr:SDR family NAD(P)-dependent oxidoreductase [Sphingopyxis sp. YF1]UNU41828.1 SDR family oxidoreductase [Sphingopyxis sp. YF1]
MKVDLTGKSALVTGGGRGIGRVIATQLVQNGARVTIATRTEASGAAVRDELRAMGGEVELVALDLSTRAACDAAVEAAADAFGGLDIVVHNSGIFPFTPFEKLEDDEFDAVMRTNLYSFMWLSRAALPHIKAGGNGRIVGISSLIGNHAWLAGLDAYAASKGGMNGIARNLALEFAKHSATVNIIEPGLVIDDRSPRMDDVTRDKIVPNIPMQRAGLPSDIANAVLFFCSPTSQFVTGQALIVDGGHMLPDMSSYAMSARL